MNHGERGGIGGRGEQENGLEAGDLTGLVIGMAIRVHKATGPGLFEHFYDLDFELSRAGLRFQRQVALPAIYEGVHFKRSYRADLMVEETILIEIKSIETILPIHETQLLTYLHLSGCRVGRLLNFNTILLKHGLRRFVRTSPRPPVTPRPP